MEKSGEDRQAYRDREYERERERERERECVCVCEREKGNEKKGRKNLMKDNNCGTTDTCSTDNA
jgi:hypothetical protein